MAVKTLLDFTKLVEFLEQIPHITKKLWESLLSYHPRISHCCIHFCEWCEYVGERSPRHTPARAFNTSHTSIFRIIIIILFIPRNITSWERPQGCVEVKTFTHAAAYFRSGVVFSIVFRWRDLCVVSPPPVPYPRSVVLPCSGCMYGLYMNMGVWYGVVITYTFRAVGGK